MENRELKSNSTGWQELNETVKVACFSFSGNYIATSPASSQAFLPILACMYAVHTQGTPMGFGPITLLISEEKTKHTLYCFGWCHRIIEYLEFEGTHKGSLGPTPKESALPVFPLSFEPGMFHMLGEHDNHYTMGTLLQNLSKQVPYFLFAPEAESTSIFVHLRTE